MPLFPAQTLAGVPQNYVSTYDVEGPLLADAVITNGTWTATSTTPVANQGYFYPVIIRTPMTIVYVTILNGAVAANSNMDLGLYDEFGNRVLSTGAVSQLSASASTYQKFLLGTSVSVNPGLYYAAAVFTSTSNRFATNGAMSVAKGRAVGMLEAASIGTTLPATVTYSAKTTTSGVAWMAFHTTGLVM